GLAEYTFRHLAGGDVVVKDRNSPVLGRVSPVMKPGVPGFVIKLELYGHLLGHRPTQFGLEHRTARRGEQLPLRLADLVLAPDAVAALGLGVYVGETPLAVEGDEGVGDALEDGGRFLLRFADLVLQFALPPGRLASDAGHFHVGARPRQQLPRAKRF